jgi:hypothetical protein
MVKMVLTSSTISRFKEADNITLEISSGVLQIKNAGVSASKLATGVVVNVPIGGVISWLKTLAHTPTLPSNFVECNGQVLSDADSVYNGDTIPNLNAGIFLRANTTSGTTGGSDTHTLTEAELPSHHHTTPTWNASGAGNGKFANTGGVTETTADTGNAGSGSAHNNIPSYYEVVMVMRIK